MSDWNETTQSGLITTGGSGASERRAYLIVLAGSNLGDMVELRDHMVLGRSAEADIRFNDDGISRRHAAVGIDGDGAFVEDLGSRNGTYVNDQKVKRAALRDGDKIRIGSTTILKFTHQDKLDDAFQRQLFEAALRDGLTRAFNKKYFFDRLTNELAYAERHRSQLAVIMLDIDFFKQVNDTYGHLAGDHVLVGVAREMQHQVRCEDVFARFGGDEFGVICRSVGVEGAAVLADRLRLRVEHAEYVYEGTTLKVTASFGVADAKSHGVRDPHTLVEAADAALYEAKRSGRNKVAVRGATAP
jgi:diguanylate cyclase (GGDEF)-like protein